MPRIETKLGDLIRAVLPTLVGGILWGYLAAAMLYGTIQA